MKRTVVILCLLVMFSIGVFAYAEEVATVPASVIWLKPALREEPHENATVIAMLSHGDDCEVVASLTEESGETENGYVYVYTDAGEGWVLDEALCYWPEKIYVSGEGVQLYASEAMRYKVTDSVPAGTELVVLEEKDMGYIVSFRGGAAFISSLENIYSVNTNAYFQHYYGLSQKAATKCEWIYSIPNDESARIGRVEVGDRIDIYTEVQDGEWLVIKVNGRYAFVQSNVVK